MRWLILRSVVFAQARFVASFRKCKNCRLKRSARKAAAGKKRKRDEREGDSSGDSESDGWGDFSGKKRGDSDDSSDESDADMSEEKPANCCTKHDCHDAKCLKKHRCRDCGEWLPLKAFGIADRDWGKRKIGERYAACKKHRVRATRCFVLKVFAGWRPPA